MQATDTRLQHGTLTLGADDGIHLAACLLHHLLNVGGMDTTVGNELLQRHAGDLAADGLKAGHGNGLGGIVDNEIGTGSRFDGADVAALAADDAALHLVIGQGYHTDGDLGDMVGGAALDGGGHDLAGTLVGLLLGAGFDLLDLHSSLVGHLGLHLLDEVILGLLGGKAGDALQHLGLAALNKADLLLLTVGGGVLGSQRLLLLLQSFGLFVDVLFFLLQTALLLLQVGAALADFLLVFVAGAQDLFLRLHQCLTLLALGIFNGLVDNAQRLCLGIGDLALVILSLLTVNENTSEDAQNKRHDCRNGNHYKVVHGFLLLQCNASNSVDCVS